MWWIYFAKPAARPRLAVERRVAFLVGLRPLRGVRGAAAVGAGVTVVVGQVTGRTHLADAAAAASFTIPVILYLVAVTFIHTLLYGARRQHLVAMVAGIALVGAATFTGQPVLLSGLVLSVLVGVLVVLHERSSH